MEVLSCGLVFAVFMIILIGGFRQEYLRLNKEITDEYD